METKTVWIALDEQQQELQEQANRAINTRMAEINNQAEELIKKRAALEKWTAELATQKQKLDQWAADLDRRQAEITNREAAITEQAIRLDNLRQALDDRAEGLTFAEYNQDNGIQFPLCNAIRYNEPTSRQYHATVIHSNPDYCNGLPRRRV